MSSVEFKLRRLLEDATFFIKNAVEDETYHEKSKNCLDEADSLVLANTRESFIEISAETLVFLAEVALLSEKRNESAERVLNIFFQRITQED
jgi:phosphomevalonate kinase